MRFENVNGKMIYCEKSTINYLEKKSSPSINKSPVVSYKWEFPTTTIHNSPTIPSSKSLNKNSSYSTNNNILTTKKKSGGVYARSSLLAGATSIPILAVATGADSGVFWETFLKYIFPWMIDIAKVFCAIKIAQAFYQENRGGREAGTGTSAFVTYGKWYLLFWMIPWGVELVDQIGEKMFTDLQSQTP